MTAEEFAKAFPLPVKSGRSSINAETKALALELFKLKYCPKFVAQKLGVGYDALLRATKEERLAQKH